MSPYKTPDNGTVICNCFAQDDYGRDRQYTSYQYLRKSLLQAKTYVEGYLKDVPQTPVSIRIPYGLGCGLAGGDWNMVYGILNEVFCGCNDNYMHVCICKLPEKQKEYAK